MTIRILLSDPQRRALARLAEHTYGCDPRELARVAVEEMLSAHRARKAPARRSITRSEVRHAEVTPRPPAASALASSSAPRTYQPKTCVRCRKPFMPTGPRAKACATCRGPRATSPAPEPELETVWDGTKGRHGASLTSH